MFLATGSPLLLNVLKDSRSETLRVTGEDGCLAHVFKPQKQHDDALESDAAACVGRCAVAERVDVRLDLVGSHSLHDALLLEQLRVMHTLWCPRQNQHTTPQWQQQKPREKNLLVCVSFFLSLWEEPFLGCNEP